jgi:hypothetical protein
MHTSAVDRPRLRGGTPPPDSSYDIDIIILALDRFDETIKAVISALDQTGPSFHVHILDQGSAPETQARFTLAFRGVSNISYYVTDKNLGVPGGRNFLSEVGKGRIIIALDNDAVFADRNVAAQVVAAFDRDRSLGAVAFNILAADGVQPDRSSWGYPARMMDRRRRLRQQPVLHLGRTRFLPPGHRLGMGDPLRWFIARDPQTLRQGAPILEQRQNKAVCPQPSHHREEMACLLDRADTTNSWLSDSRHSGPPPLANAIRHHRGVSP